MFPWVIIINDVAMLPVIKRSPIVLCFLLFWAVDWMPVHAADSLLLFSPDKKIRVSISLTNGIHYGIDFMGERLLQPSAIDLFVEDRRPLTADLRSKTIKNRFADRTIISPVPEKRIAVRDHYNELIITFRQPYTLYFRAYNDGVAYRLQTRFNDSIIITDEVAEFNLNKGAQVLLPLLQPREGVDRFHTSFEELYTSVRVDSLKQDTLAYTPVLAGNDDAPKVAITESDLYDYPGMFLTGNGGAGLKGVFAPYPLAETMTGGEFPQLIVSKRAKYIARSEGSRLLPWRVLMIAAEDKELPGNDLVYRLATPPTTTDHSWISPGIGTDEWIIGINLFNVSFKSGVNTATYKYYIDFARSFGLERIMMDAGWSNYQDLFDINPNLNMDTISAYAKENGIRLSMWTLCSTLDRQLDSALVQFSKWGVDFIMTDFMDRDDQKMVKFYHRVAAACASRKIMVMFHGAFPPKGFNRTYPNAVTREAVLGSEYNIWSNKVTPGHDLTLPFTRMLSGPLDYEPGILDNATKEQFRAIGKKVMTQGTRCHQLAMFVVYDSPVQFFSGNPSQAMLEPQFMELLGTIPTTWDETKILEGKVGKHIITARKKGEEWFLGGMTDWEPRNFSIPLSFLSEGPYEVIMCIDGVNADQYPADYAFRNIVVKSSDTVPVRMSAGGGFVMRFKPQKQ